MPSTFSPALRLELIGNGEQAANWGNTTNTNLGTLLEQAITGVGNITMLDANYTLISGNGVSDEARNAVLVISGTLTTTRSVIVPSSNKFYAVRNATTGGQSILIRTAAGTGVTLANGFTQLMYCDGTDVSLASVPVNPSTGSVVLNNPTINGFTGNTAVINVGSGQFYKEVGGNVGIGTTTPTQRLQVAGATRLDGNIESSVSPFLYSWQGGIAGAVRSGFLLDGSGQTLQLYTGTIERVRLDASGNVGIGTISGGLRLDVSGPSVVGRFNSSNNNNVVAISSFGTIGGYLGANGTNFLIGNSNGNESLRVDVNGNVGIGTTSPTNRLSVSGNANVTGDLAVTGNITSGGGLVMPTGAILEYGGATAPTGWLICDGAAVSRAAYAALFAIIGTAYGAGDGFTTFNLPDRRDRVAVGSGSTYARGATGGAVTATTSTNGAHNHTGATGSTTLTTAQIPSHTHTGTTSTNGNHSHDFNGLTAPVQGSGFGYNIGTGTTTGSITGTNTTGAHNHTFTTDATGGGGSHDHTISTDGSHTHTVSTLQPYLASTFIIKT